MAVLSRRMGNNLLYLAITASMVWSCARRSAIMPSSSWRCARCAAISSARSASLTETISGGAPEGGRKGRDFRQARAASRRTASTDLIWNSAVSLEISASTRVVSNSIRTPSRSTRLPSSTAMRRTFPCSKERMTFTCPVGTIRPGATAATSTSAIEAQVRVATRKTQSETSRMISARRDLFTASSRSLSARVCLDPRSCLEMLP